MDLINKITSESDVFYKKNDLPKLKVGDKVKIVNYLELPTEVEEKPGSNKKKKKERLQLYEGVIISKHGKTITPDSTITVRKMFQGGGIEKVFVIYRLRSLTRRNYDGLLAGRSRGIHNCPPGAPGPPRNPLGIPWAPGD